MENDNYDTQDLLNVIAGLERDIIEAYDVLGDALYAADGTKPYLAACLLGDGAEGARKRLNTTLEILGRSFRYPNYQRHNHP